MQIGNGLWGVAIMEVIDIEAFIMVVLLIVNIPLYKIIFKPMFRDSDDFKESVRYSFTPDLFSLFRGQYWKDQIGEAKLSFFIIACISAIAFEYFIIKAVIGIFV